MILKGKTQNQILFHNAINLRCGCGAASHQSCCAWRILFFYGHIDPSNYPCKNLDHLGWMVRSIHSSNAWNPIAQNGLWIVRDDSRRYWCCFRRQSNRVWQYRTWRDPKHLSGKHQLLLHCKRLEVLKLHPPNSGILPGSHWVRKRTCGMNSNCVS